MHNLIGSPTFSDHTQAECECGWKSSRQEGWGQYPSAIVFSEHLNHQEEMGVPVTQKSKDDLRYAAAVMTGGVDLKEDRPCKWFYLMALFVTAGVLIGYYVT